MCKQRVRNTHGLLVHNLDCRLLLIIGFFVNVSETQFNFVSFVTVKISGQESFVFFEGVVFFFEEKGFNLDVCGLRVAILHIFHDYIQINAEFDFHWVQTLVFFYLLLIQEFVLALNNLVSVHMLSVVLCFFSFLVLKFQTVQTKQVLGKILIQISFVEGAFGCISYFLCSLSSFIKVKL